MVEERMDARRGEGMWLERKMVGTCGRIARGRRRGDVGECLVRLMYSDWWVYLAGYSKDAWACRRTKPQNTANNRESCRDNAGNTIVAPLKMPIDNPQRPL